MGFVVDIIEDGIDFLKDVLDSLVDFTKDAFKAIWKITIEYPAELVFKVIGITDEDLLVVSKSTQLVFKDNVDDVVQKAQDKAAISMMKKGGDFFHWYDFNISISKRQITTFYRTAERGDYIHGLPTMEVRGGDIDFAAITAAINLSTGLTTTRLSVNTITPDDATYFKHMLQAAPYYYKPYVNTLQFTDPYGVLRADYYIDTITFNVNTGKHEIAVARVAEEALFWIEGPSAIVEGDNATYTVKCNRTVPTGKSISIQINYSGTALSRRYFKVPVVTMLAGTSEVSFIVKTDENPQADGNKTIIVSIGELAGNPAGTFEAMGKHPVDSVTTTLIDDEGIILTMSSHTVAEADGSVTIPVKLENATAGAFTVDYVPADGTATGGFVDYDSTPGTLSFAGTAGEVQNIVISITSDAPDDKEYFTVGLTNCSDPAVDISQNSLVTIVDGTEVFAPQGTTTLTGVIRRAGYVRKLSLVVTYHETALPEELWYYWIYKFEDGTYPGINPQVSILSELEMLPVAILKRNGGSVDTSKTSEEYLSTRRLLQALELDIDQILDGLKEDTNYNLIQDAYVGFAICPNSVVEIISKALWVSFYNLVVTHALTSNENTFIASFEEQRVNNVMTWTKHFHETGKVGTLTDSKNYHHYIGEITENGKTGTLLYIQHQTAPGLFEELRIQDLNGMSTIKKDGYASIAANALGDATFTIPVSHFIINQLTKKEQLVLYEHILRIDAYAAELQHLEFYETEAFINFFNFAAIAITIFTLGTASGYVEIAKQLLYQYLVTQLVIKIAELTGSPELAALIGLAALAVGGTYSGDSALGFLEPEMLLLASTNFADNLTTVYNLDMQGIKTEIEQLEEMYEERLEAHEIKEDNPITAEFLVALNSIDNGTFPAIRAQYDFDVMFEYDVIIKDYYNNHYRTGID